MLLSVGPLADYRRNHRKLLLTATVVASVIMILIGASPAMPWQVCAALLIVGNMTYGLADTWYNAYLPKVRGEQGGHWLCERLGCFWWQSSYFVYLKF